MKNTRTDHVVVLNNGKKLAYAEYGDPQGKPVFLFHGWPSSRLQGAVFDSAAKHIGARIICPDRPGYGLSDFIADRTLLDWPDTVIQLADVLRVKTFAVLGVSGGGPYAAACAYKIPGRLKKVGIAVGLSPTNITGVLQGMSFINRLIWRYYYRFPILMSISSLILVLQAKRLLPTVHAHVYPARADQNLLMSEPTRSSWARNRKEAFRQGKQACAHDLKIYTGSWGFDVSAISVPVHLWYGQADKNVSPEMGNYYHRTIQNSTLTVYPGEGHLLYYKHGEEILSALVNRK